MAVLRSKRKISKIEFENTFAKLYHYSANQTAKISKRKRKWLCNKINNKMNNIYNSIMELNEILYSKEFSKEEKKILIQQIISELITLDKPLYILWNIEKYKTKTMAYWCDLLQNEYNLLCKMIKMKPKYKFKILDYKAINNAKFIKNMSEFHRFVHSKIIKAPCKYDDTSGNLLIKLVDDAFYFVIQANKKIPKTQQEFKQRIKYINKAITGLYKMQRQIIFYCNLMQYSEKILKEWNYYLTSELKMLKALKKSDIVRFGNLQ